MMKNAFYFTSIALFVLEIFKFSHVTKRLYKKDTINFKFYDVTTWLANNRKIVSWTIWSVNRM